MHTRSMKAGEAGRAGQAGRAGRRLGSAGSLVGCFIGCLVGSALTPSRAVAGECGVPVGAGAALAERDTEARLRFLRESLAETARKERRYLLGTSLAYAGFAGGSWVLVPLSDDPGKRVDAIWSSSTSIAGGLQNLIEPLLVMRDHRQAEELVARAAAVSGEPRCRLLREAELRLEHAAKSETSAKGPFARIGGALINVGLGLVLAYGLKRPASAAQNTTIGLLVTQVMIEARPTEAIRRLERYRAGDLGGGSQPSRVVLSPLFAPTNDGLSVGLAGSF